ncbi:hypothetical protein FOS14_21180 [Skermania sp. ID1734]|uniref:hypothetical protein n=1 Tax=Skermania sp. ID1734 TaxID=2597516 RepID=UPI0011800321|nr:hypothetical protein [Skermania sp. ID1734]TSD94270.1 hypothetical protein FOS14_21180 [Skermania sp. ID1734]
MITSESAHPLRLSAAAAGVLTGVLGLAAHSVGCGREMISSPIAAIAVVVACVVAAVARSVSPATLRLVAILGGGQVLVHFGMQTVEPSAMMPAMSGQMLVSHTVATVACALLLAAATRLYGPITTAAQAFWRSVIPLVLPQEAAATVVVSADTAAAGLARQCLVAAVRWRGPPVDARTQILAGGAARSRRKAHF